MSALEAVGAITVGLLALAVILLFLTIVANVVCGAAGAYRAQVIRRRPARRPPTWKEHKAAWRLGFGTWYGARYDGRAGEYWQMGGLQVPLDIRDPIRRR